MHKGFTKIRISLQKSPLVSEVDELYTTFQLPWIPSSKFKEINFLSCVMLNTLRSSKSQYALKLTNSIEFYHFFFLKKNPYNLVLFEKVVVREIHSKDMPGQPKISLFGSRKGYSRSFSCSKSYK